MNIRIKRVNEIAYNAGIKIRLLRVLAYPCGLASLALFLILLLIETYYQNLSAKPGTTYIGGLGTWLGLLILIGAVINANRPWSDFLRLIKSGEVKEPYIDLTDDYVESGIENLGYHRHSWISLVKMAEGPKSFTLTMKFGAQIGIFKSDLDKKVTVEELRTFLNGKLLKK